MDIYEALIGGGPTSGDQMRALAAALRKQKTLGSVLSASGDRALGPIGGQLGNDADQNAQFVGQQGALEKWRQLQTETQRETAHQSSLDRQETTAARLEASKDRDKILQAIADDRLAATTRPKVKALTSTEKVKLENTGQIVGNTKALIDTFKPEYTQRYGTIAGSANKLSNALTAVGMNSKEGDEAANWWGQWNLVYTLPQRLAVFGATLTPHEKEAWAESDINPSMNAETIKARSRKVFNIIASKARVMDKEYRAQGQDPDVMDTYGLDVQDLVDELPPGAAGGKGMPPGFEHLTPAEQAEYRQLRGN